MSIAIIVGAGFVAFISAFMLLRLGDRASMEGHNLHYGLQIILYGLVVLSIFFIGKAVLDSSEQCGLMLVNETTIGNTTSYNYNTVCDESPAHNTGLTFYKFITWFMRLMGLYFGGYVIYIIGAMLYARWKKVRFK